MDEIDLPRPDWCEVLVEIHAASINPVDAKYRTAGPKGGPKFTGSGFAGVISRREGHWFRGGSLVNYTVVPTHLLLPLPDDVSFAGSGDRTRWCPRLASVRPRGNGRRRSRRRRSRRRDARFGRGPPGRSTTGRPRDSAPTPSSITPGTISPRPSGSRPAASTSYSITCRGLPRDQCRDGDVQWPCNRHRGQLGYDPGYVDGTVEGTPSTDVSISNLARRPDTPNIGSLAR